MCRIHFIKNYAWSLKTCAQMTNLHDAICSGRSLVGVADVEAAVKEMFQAPHIQVSIQL